MEFAGMVDLARTPKEANEDRAKYEASPAATISEPVYPYGMCIRMEDEVLDKLGLGGDLPEIGEMVHIVGMAKVTSASQREEIMPDGSKQRRCCVELQITHLAAEDEDRETSLEDREARDKAKSDAFYGDAAGDGEGEE